MKKYISAEELQVLSYKLGAAVYKDLYFPDFIVAIWRGGAVIGCYVHELLKWKGLNPDHIAIRTSKYTGIDQAATTVQVHNLGYLKEKIVPGNRVLLVDDVWDSGHSIDAFVEKLEQDLGKELFESITVKVATVYYKPTR